MDIVLGRILPDLVENNGVLLKQFFEGFQQDPPEDAPEEIDEAFEQLVTETIKACDTQGLAEIILQAPVNTAVGEDEFWIDPKWEADSPGLSFLRSSARSALIGWLYVQFTGSL